MKTTLHFADETDTVRFGHDLAMALKSGDIVTLKGELGAGKSSLARAIIRQMAGDFALEVPSPTFTLEQVYATEPQIHHFDFYRLKDISEVDELGLEEALDTGVAIIEWSEIAEAMLPPDRMDILLSEEADGGRRAVISGSGEIMKRVMRSLAIRKFLDTKWCSGLDRKPLTGDASTRAYELVTKGNETRILMNAARQSDGPEIKNGKPYSQIAHLAEDVSAFVAIDKVLRQNRFGAPEIYAHDLDAGLVLIEHLGTQGIITANAEPVSERYLASVELLARIHAISWPESIHLGNDVCHHIAYYDHDAMMIEVELLTEWYAPHRTGSHLSRQALEEFEQIWSDLFSQLSKYPKTLVLRDYHSPNIIWQPANSGIDRVGIIDFQDALIGPQPYDVASLAQDARVGVSQDLETAIVDHYVSVKSAADDSFDEGGFREVYAIMAAQRATKILGIFVRLHKRDNKPDYLGHLPRIADYLARSFKHPVLDPYHDWFEQYLSTGNRKTHRPEREVK